MQTKRTTMIVAGAAKGIGAGVTNAFVERDHSVVANSLNITTSTFAATDRLAAEVGTLRTESEQIAENKLARDVVWVSVRRQGSAASHKTRVELLQARLTHMPARADLDHTIRRTPRQ